MIPASALDITELETVDYPSTTYKLDLTTKRIGSKISGQDAAMQAVAKVLLTERYSRVIYSGNYGIEFEDLIGENYDYVIADLKRRLESALLVDDRIQGISTLVLSNNHDSSLTASFAVQSVEGAFNISAEVAL